MFKKAISFMKHVNSSAELRRYHDRHRSEALSKLQSAERTFGSLSSQNRRRATEYATEILGWRGYAPWLYAYSAVAGKFLEGWIPDNYYGRVVLPHSAGRHEMPLNNKVLSRKLLQAQESPDIGYYVNGLFYNQSYAPVARGEFAREVLGKYDRVVFKVELTSRGRDVQIVDRTRYADFLRGVSANGVFQRYISQHEFFDSIIDGSIATLRITTVVTNEGVASARGAHLRAARTGQSHVLAGDQVAIPVSLASGRLSDLGFLSDWTCVPSHPDTGFVFGGNIVPMFSDCVESCVSLHRKFPFVRCVGWDVIVSSDSKVELIESNAGHNGIKLAEATVGPMFADMGWETLWRKGRRR